MERTTFPPFGLSVIGPVMAAVVVMTVTACSSDQPKPMAQPTSDQVRSHADHAFDKLKQEERERAVQPPTP